jgi:hypothetical protein
MQTLEDISLVCCSVMCCGGIVGFLMVKTFARRIGGGWRDVARQGGGLFGIDLPFLDILGIGGDNEGGGRKRK